MKLKLQLLVIVVVALLTAMIMLSSIARGVSSNSKATAEQPTPAVHQAIDVPTR
jgi:hypothetical protein